jgi:hypothetical protein
VDELGGLDPSDPLALARNMGFNLSPMYLLAGLVFSVVGFYYWRVGKTRQYRKTYWTGIVLMAYPIFVSNTFLVWCIGVFLWAVAYYFCVEGQ